MSLWLISKVLKKLILTVCVCLLVYQYCDGFYEGVGFQRSLLCQSRSILASGLIFDKGVKAIHWVKDSLSTNGLKQLNIYMQSINT